MIGYAFTGSFCTLSHSLAALRRLRADGADVLPIFSNNVYSTDTRFWRAEEFYGAVRALCDREIIHTIVDAEPLGPAMPLEALVIAPCTGNTLSKLSLGIIDSTVAMAAKAHLRNARPLLLAIASNDALSVGLRHIGALTLRKNIFFVPFGQDDPFEKPTSLIADFSKIPKAISAAMENKQLQPILLGS